MLNAARPAHRVLGAGDRQADPTLAPRARPARPPPGATAGHRRLRVRAATSRAPSAPSTRARADTRSPTLPSAGIPRNPRLPTTTRSASRDAATSASAGGRGSSTAPGWRVRSRSRSSGRPPTAATSFSSASARAARSAATLDCTGCPAAAVDAGHDPAWRAVPVPRTTSTEPRAARRMPAATSPVNGSRPGSWPAHGDQRGRLGAGHRQARLHRVADQQVAGAGIAGALRLGQPGQRVAVALRAPSAAARSPLARRCRYRQRRPAPAGRRRGSSRRRGRGRLDARLRRAEQGQHACERILRDGGYGEP